MNSVTIGAAILFVIDLVIKLAFIVYIPRKRNPSSAIAWLLLLLIIPYIGILLFLLIGSPKLNKYRRKQQRYIDNLISSRNTVKGNQLKSLPKEARVRAKHIADLAMSLGKFPAVAGNKVKILPEYNKAIADIIKEINVAKDHVNVEYFIVAYDETTKPFFEAMEQAVQRGVKVRLMFDALGYKAYPNKKQMRSELTRMGIDWHMMLPIRFTRKGYNRPDLRNHRKIVVIDSRVAYVGSQNMIDRTYHRKDDIFYDELVAKMEGPAATECNAIFASDWFTETGKNLGKELELNKLAPKVSDVVLQMLPSGSNFDQMNNARVFTALIQSAEKEVFITNPYFVPTDAMLDAVTSAAIRGVKVTILNSESMDQWMVGHAQRSFYQQLLECGVNIYLYKSPVLLHSKHMTIDDDMAVVGSSNMDIRSFELNLECVMLAYDKSVVRDLRKVQVENIKRSNKVNLKTWNKRSLWQDLRDSVARMTSAIQ
jgi:cardiolipin synthase